MLLNGTLVGIDAPEDVNESCIASFLRDAVTIAVAARYREKRIILPMFFGLLSVGIFYYKTSLCMDNTGLGLV